MQHSDSKEITQFSQYITDIMDARDDESNTVQSYDCVDKLPTALIGECASYLPLNEYITFS